MSLSLLWDLIHGPSPSSLLFLPTQSGSVHTVAPSPLWTKFENLWCSRCDRLRWPQVLRRKCPHGEFDVLKFCRKTKPRFSEFCDVPSMAFGIEIKMSAGLRNKRLTPTKRDIKINRKNSTLTIQTRDWWHHHACSCSPCRRRCASKSTVHVLFPFFTPHWSFYSVIKSQNQSESIMTVVLILCLVVSGRLKWRARSWTSSSYLKYSIMTEVQNKKYFLSSVEKNDISYVRLHNENYGRQFWPTWDLKFNTLFPKFEFKTLKFTFLSAIHNDDMFGI